MGFERVHRKLIKCLHLYLAETARCGIGVFAARPFRRGAPIVQDLDGDYYDTVFSYEQMTLQGYDVVQVSSQIGDDAYLLPNGNIDDFTNHSCDPNSGLRLVPGGYVMIALRDISTHEEVTYDYSTYLAGSRERFDCLCGAKRCRGVIGDFVDLPEDLQRYYLEWDVVGRFAARPLAAVGTDRSRS
jgi:hypothetical protein